MRFSFLPLFYGTILLLTINSCCFTVACDLAEPTLNLRIMRDGKNALFGPDAFIPADSVRLSILEPLRPYPGSYTFEREEILQFTVREGEQYLLEIPGIPPDTFKVITATVITGGCCNGIGLAEVRRNGEIICEDNCAQVIEIEI